MEYKLPELLAPAGSYEIMEQAFQAGADAVYVGGQVFGARAYADNLTEEELLRGIKYARFHHKKLYLTVNTLLKNEEIDRLSAFLKAPYEAGLHAVIVQDLGVAKIIHQQFPELDLHISTQLSVTSCYAANLLKELGAVRIVPARELTMEELHFLKQETGLELEVFIHGALCYSYSGHCLFSSMIGGRSGNRGRCAQPCRQQYRLDNGEEAYYLSPKDLCGLRQVSALIEDEIDSLKIEGRMKKPEYVIATVQAYRRVLDSCVSGKRLDLVDEREKLADIYNRGGFTEGYFHQKNGVQMMSMERNNHNGVRLGQVCSVSGSKIEIELERNLNPGDILEVRIQSGAVIELTSGQEGTAGNRVFINGKQLRSIQKGDWVYRTKNHQLCQDLLQENQLHRLKENINISVILRKGKSAMITAECDNQSVTVIGEMVTEAVKQPLTKELIIEKLHKMGDNPFVLNEINLDMDEDCFYPMKDFNTLRRQALQELLTVCENQGSRIGKEITDKNVFNLSGKSEGENTRNKSKKEHFLAVSVSTLEQLETLLTMPQIDRIDLEIEAQCFTVEQTALALKNIHEHNKQGYISLPRMFRMDMENILNAYISLESDGYVIRTLDELGWIKKWKPMANRVLDYSVYAYNREAVDCYDLWVDARQFLTLPVELDKNNLTNLLEETQGHTWEWIVYGAQPVMITAQCTRKNTSVCTQDFSALTLENSFRDRFRVQSVCRFCYNVIYQETPVSLLSVLPEQKQAEIGVYRFQLTTETPQELERLFQQPALQTGNEGRYRKGME